MFARRPLLHHVDGLKDIYYAIGIYIHYIYKCAHVMITSHVIYHNYIDLHVSDLQCMQLYVEE